MSSPRVGEQRLAAAVTAARCEDAQTLITDRGSDRQHGCELRDAPPRHPLTARSD
ncbi:MULTISPECIES: hypothetical protein [Xanthomonas]|uniref:hypothetical protein n=1 Tax=Xanthomonas TaxID=338 RepID=UPI000ACEE2FC|nr:MULTISPECIES: hypothetical protein [Xanthomonas]